jgi:hypothetical protein
MGCPQWLHLQSSSCVNIRTIPAIIGRLARALVAVNGNRSTVPCFMLLEIYESSCPAPPAHCRHNYSHWPNSFLTPLTQSHLQTCKRFSLLQNVQADSATHPASYSTGTGCSFMGVKWPEREVHIWPPSTPIPIHSVDKGHFTFNFLPHKCHFISNNSGFIFRLYRSHEVSVRRWH